MSSLRPRTTVRLTIRGMTSVHAARAIHTALAGVEGIELADVGRGIATIQHDGRVTEADLRAAVSLAGFEVAEMREERRVLPIV